MDGPRWHVEGRGWPNRASSRFVRADGLTWHVQVMGSGPGLLLVHGTGAATHTWRDLAPLLAKHFTVVAPDLPGHGFTQMPRSGRLSIQEMASGLHALLAALGTRPEVGVGHSAGAPILCQMTLDLRTDFRFLASLNGAFFPFRGWAGPLASGTARLMANGLWPRWVAWRARDRDVVDRLIQGTGSRLDPEGIELYQRLVSHPGHVAAALHMMAHWNLGPVARELHQIQTPVLLLVGDEDRAVPPDESARIARRLPRARVVSIPWSGHLSHEERPDATARAIVDGAQAAGVLAGRVAADASTSE
jgi:magnesium chelatase accessory protein